MEKVEHENDPLKSYLAYYKSIHKPGYAVLVTGEWGIGKTYQVKQFLEPEEYHYISLFGLNSASEVYGTVFERMDPEGARRKKTAEWLDGKSVSLFGFSGPVGSILAAGLDATVRDDVDASKILVFDDLERSTIDNRTLLGIINFYVEHHGCRVIVIAHDEKLLGGFSESKEKIFGQTVRVVPRWQEAYASFVCTASQVTSTILSTYSQQLKTLFVLSGCNSLRVLRHVVADLDRFLPLFEEEQLLHPAMSRIFKIFVALDIEIRSGALARSDLSDRLEFRIRSQLSDFSKANLEPKSDSDERMFLSRKKFETEVDICNLELPDSLLCQMLFDGRYDGSNLQAVLAENEVFRKVSKMPAWRRFLEFDELPDDIVNDAATEMDTDFHNRRILNIGELLHVVSLQIMRAENGLLRATRKGILKNAKLYLDDLVRLNRFPLIFEYDDLEDHPAYGGIIFWGAESNGDFLAEFLSHAKQCEEKNLKRHQKEFAADVLGSLAEGFAEFSSLLLTNDQAVAKFERIPVLHLIPPEELVSAFLLLPQTQWKQVRRVLRKRKERTSQYSSLKVELPWFDLLDMELERRAKKLKNSIGALRIQRLKIS